MGFNTLQGGHHEAVNFARMILLLSGELASKTLELNSLEEA